MNSELWDRTELKLNIKLQTRTEPDRKLNKILYSFYSNPNRSIFKYINEPESNIEKKKNKFEINNALFGGLIN